MVGQRADVDFLKRRAKEGTVGFLKLGDGDGFVGYLSVTRAVESRMYKNKDGTPKEMMEYTLVDEEGIPKVFSTSSFRLIETLSRCQIGSKVKISGYLKGEKIVKDITLLEQGEGYLPKHLEVPF